MGVDVEKLKSLIQYFPESGEFRWLRDRGRLAKCGDLAGRTDTYGHRQITINGKAHLAHRLAVLYMTGELPNHQVDHKNKIRSDNRWSNLRQATHSQNCVNRATTNTHGYLGVVKVGERYGSSISFRLPDGKKKRIHLGMFSSAKEAHDAYMLACRSRNGEFTPALAS
jgi:hypothetical protein